MATSATQRATRQPQNTRKRQTTRATRAAVSPVTPMESTGAGDGVRDGVERIPLTYDTRLLLTVKDAAARLSISRAFLYRLIERGDVPSITIGERMRRIPAAALDAYIAAQMTAQGVRGVHV